MKKLIRDKATRAFLAKEGRWTGNIADAQVIKDPAEGATIAAKLGQKVELYYAFGEYETTDWDFALPLN